MAAIDKIYVNTYEQYLQFKEWCKQQPPILDKYNKKVKITDYLFKRETWKEGKSYPIFSAPYYIDAYLIRNCPFDFIQKDLMLNYGHWDTPRIKEFYDEVKNWDSSKGECPYWTKLEDFEILEDGTLTIKGLEESDYSKIKRGILYNSPTTNKKYTVGKHFKCISHPSKRYNIPTRYYHVSVESPIGFMWYNKEHKSWDFPDEFVDVISFRSCATHLKSIKAIKRHILKWKLPIGTIVYVHGRYLSEDYTFKVTK